MNSLTSQNIKKAKDWLTHDVYPLWAEKGIDRKNGGFIESISFSSESLIQPRRAMVQARQIYSFLTGLNMGCCPRNIAMFAVEQGIDYLVERYSLPSGAFIYSVNANGSAYGLTPDLYTQAFALFGMAQAYTLSNDPAIKNRAKDLLKYLYRERKVTSGGFTEVDDKGSVSFKSNPHMHLFESAIAWMQIDPDAEWKQLGQELLELCLNKFIDPETQVLGEYFDQNWNHLRENGNFIYEPGHQYEWAWLMSLYENLTGKNLKAVRHQLFLLAEKYGISKSRKVVFDEMWSDYTPKTQSSRFWPQCERIKAASRLSKEVAVQDQPQYRKAADEALETLFKFFETPVKGLWFDILSENDTFNANSAKASSLYHIVNAIEEYEKYA